MSLPHSEPRKVNRRVGRRARTAALVLAFTFPGLAATTMLVGANAQPTTDRTTDVASHPLERLAGEVPDVVEIHLSGVRELDRLVATGVDLDHGVSREGSGLAVHAIITPNEADALTDMGFKLGDVLYTEADSEAVLAEREASIKAARAENRRFQADATSPDVSDVKIIRADYYTSYGVPILSVEAKWANGQTVSTALTVERDSGPGTAFGSGGTQNISRFVDAGVYMYHRGASPTTGASALTTRPDRIRITSPSGDTAIAKVNDWLPTGDETDPFKGEGYQEDFVQRYLDPTDLYNRIRVLAETYPNISEIVELPNKTAGYQRKAQALVGTAAANYVGLDSLAWGHEGGNRLRIAVVHPTAADQVLSVTTATTGTGANQVTTITVNSATNAAGAATSTAKQIVDAINAHAGASALVQAYTYRNNAGTGVVPATAVTALSDNLAAPASIVRGPAKVYALKIGKHRDGSKPGVFFYAQEHAREWVPPLVTIETAERLLRNYATHAPTKDLVDNLEIWIAPSINPDGGHYSFYDFASQRRNLTRYCAITSNYDMNARNSWGVDVNRNYSEYSIVDGPWNGASTSCTSDTFAGPGELSEPEAANVDWIAAHPNMEWSMNVHSAGNYFMWSPGAYKTGTRETAPYPTLEQEDLYWGASKRILTAIKRYRGLSVTPARTGPVIDVLYSAAGNSGDMLWYKYGLYAWDFEVGSTFQPPFINFDNPNAAQAHSETMEFANGLIEMARVARDFDSDDTPPVSSIEVSPSANEGKVGIRFDTNESAVIYYTTDGSIPTTASTVYAVAGVREGPARVLVDEGAEIRWIAVDSRGNVERHYEVGQPGNYRSWIAKVGWQPAAAASSTKLGIDKPSVTVGKSGVTATVTVKGTEPGDQPVATGHVEVLADGVKIATGTLDASGKASVALPAMSSVGIKQLTASFAGDTHLAASSSAKVPLEVTADPGKTSAEVSLSLSAPSTRAGLSDVTAKVAVKAVGGPSQPNASGHIDLLADGKRFATAILDATGAASIDLPALATAGVRSLTAEYSAGNLPDSKSASTTLTVKKAQTKLKVSATPKRAVVGAKMVRVKVTLVAPGAKLGGRVKATVAGKVVARAKANKFGSATMWLPAFTKPGSTKVKVQYVGNKHLTKATKVVTVRVAR